VWRSYTRPQRSAITNNIANKAYQKVTELCSLSSHRSLEALKANLAQAHSIVIEQCAKNPTSQSSRLIKSLYDRAGEETTKITSLACSTAEKLAKPFELPDTPTIKVSSIDMPIPQETSIPLPTCGVPDATFCPTAGECLPVKIIPLEQPQCGGGSGWISSDRAHELGEGDVAVPLPETIGIEGDVQEKIIEQIIPATVDISIPVPEAVKTPVQARSFDEQIDYVLDDALRKIEELKRLANEELAKTNLNGEKAQILEQMRFEIKKCEEEALKNALKIASAQKRAEIAKLEKAYKRALKAKGLTVETMPDIIVL
jgi:hypothetical protein